MTSHDQPSTDENFLNNEEVIPERDLKFTGVESDQETLEEFQDCSNDGEDNLQVIEEFLKDCDKTLCESEENEKQLSGSSSKEVINSEKVDECTEILEKKSHNEDIGNNIIEGINNLEERINSLWEQIDEINVMISEEKSFCKEDNYEISQMVNNFINKPPPKPTCCTEASKVPENEINHEETEEFKKTLIEAKTEAKLKAKKELLKKKVSKQRESEVTQFRKRVKEMEVLCAKEMSKVTSIISELQTLKFKDDTTRYNDYVDSSNNLWNDPINLNNKQSNLMAHSSEFETLLRNKSNSMIGNYVINNENNQ